MVVMALGVLVISIAAFFRVPLLPEIGRELGMTASQLGLVTTAFAVGRLAADIPAGRLADRAVPLLLLAAAAFTLAAGSLVLAFATVPRWVIGAAFVLGVASAVANTTGMTFFSTAASLERRGLTMAVFSSALLAGQALGPLVGGVLGDLAGWRAAIGAAAAIGLVVGLALFAAGRRWRAGGTPNPARAAGEPDAFGQAGGGRGQAGGGRGQAGGGGRRGRGGRHGGPAVPARERAVLQSVAFVMFFSLGSLPQTLVPLIGAEEFGLSASAIGAALGLGGLCRFTGGLTGGLVSDRVARKAALVPGLAVQAAGVMLLATSSVAGWVAAIVVMSFASWSVSVAATVIADRARAEDVGSLLGTYRFVGDFGLIAGPLTTALLYERVGKSPAVLLVALLLAACAVACAVVVPETRWSQPREGVPR